MNAHSRSQAEVSLSEAEVRCGRETRDYIAAVVLGTVDVAKALVFAHPARERRKDREVERALFDRGEPLHVWAPFYGRIVKLELERHRKSRGATVEMHYVRGLMPGSNAVVYNGLFSTDGTADFGLIETRQQDYAPWHISQLFAALAGAAIMDGAARADNNVDCRVRVPEGATGLLSRWADVTSAEAVRQQVEALAVAPGFFCDDFPIRLQLPG